MASNCWMYVKTQIPAFPNTKNIHSNTTPAVGVVALFNYGAEDHYAIITKLEEKGFWVKDTNFGGPGYRTHFIEWNNPHITGFWK